MKKWLSWESAKALKWEVTPRHGNAELVQKAEDIAKELVRLPFVTLIALFGSAARGEIGHNIDLLVLDDGTVSAKAENWTEDSLVYWSSYTGECLNALLQFNSWSVEMNLEMNLSPRCNHLVFLKHTVATDQQYLDRLIRSSGNYEFFSQIQQDLKVFNERINIFCGEKRAGYKFRFVNDGKPGEQLMNEITEALKTQSTTAASCKPASASPCSEPIEVPVIAAIPDYTFEAIGGQTEAKYEVMGLASALNNPERYEKWGTKPPRGIMLCGPPGTGKTLLAKALSKSTNSPFYEVDASQIITKWYGESAQNVDRIFEAARSTGGVIFFDEADSLVSNRDDLTAHEESRRIVSALCRNMDGFKTSDRVVVFFATNRPEDMDQAVKRAGRIDLWVQVPLPDANGRREIFEIHIRKAEGIAGRQLFTEIDYSMLIEKTDGYSGADIAEIIRRSLEMKVRAEAEGRNPTSVTTQDVLSQIARYEQVKQVRKKIGFTKQ